MRRPRAKLGDQPVRYYDAQRLRMSITARQGLRRAKETTVRWARIGITETTKPFNGYHGFLRWAAILA
jgi:hypothetical protein